MPEGRCDLILFGWTVFIGFFLVSDLLWGDGSQSARRGDGPSPGQHLSVAPGGVGYQSSELYRGRYRLEANNSIFEEGSMRMTLAEQPTAMSSIQFSSISAKLRPDGQSRSFSPLDAGDMLFNGIELTDVGTLTATGATDASRFWRFGQQSCRLNAALMLGGDHQQNDRGGHGSGEGEKAHSENEWASIGNSGIGKSRFVSTVTGDIASLDCGFTMVFEAEVVNLLELTQKVSHYSIWANMLTILQIRCYLAQMRHTEDGPSVAKVSLFCIAFQALMDACDSFLHLCLGLASQYMFNTIAVVSLFKFMLFSLLEARYMLTIWRQRRSDIFAQGWDAVRRELSMLYTRFYGCLVVGLVLIYNTLEHLDTIVLVFQVYWVPQILHDAWQGTRSALCPTFYTGISITRSLSILYLWGCPQGIFSGDIYPRLPGAPSRHMCMMVVGLQAAQLTVMFLQRMWGPRWFVPWACMPWAYNYHKTSEIDPGSDCVICMAEIDQEDATRLVTPCAHNFHKTCLEQWMDVKMECPTCRATLPPIQ